MKAGLRFVAPLWPLLLAACGGSSPELSNLRLSADSVTVGREVFALAHLFDPDGDVDGGTLRATLVALDGDLSLDGEAPILGFEPGQLEGEVVMGLRLTGAAPQGEYRLALEAADSAGGRSETVQARWRYTVGGRGSAAASLVAGR